MLSRPFFALLFCSITFLHPILGQEQDLPLPESIHPQLAQLLVSARRNAPALKIEELGVAEAEANLDVAKRADNLTGLARVGLNALYEHRIDSEEDIQSTRFAPSAIIAIQKPLFHWGEFDAMREFASLRKRMSEASRDRVVEVIEQEVRRYYLMLLSARKSQEVAAANIDYAQRLVENQRALLESGQVARRNLLETQIFLAEREEELTQSEKAVLIYLSILEELTGIENLEIEPASPDVTWEMVPHDRLTSLSRSAGNNPEAPMIRALQAELDAEKAYEKQIGSRNKPKLDLTANAYLDYVDEYRAPGTGETTGGYESVPRVLSFAGITGTWNFFDGGQVTALRHASMARQRRAEARIERELLERRREAERIIQELELNERQIQTRQQRLELLTSTVQLMERQNADNLIPTNDLLERKIHLERTRVELLTAQSDYLLNLALLHTLATSTPAQ